MRTSYEEQLLNLTVAQQSESLASKAEIVRLTVLNESLAINSEGNQRTYHTAAAEQQSRINALTARVNALELILAETAAADDTMK
eukprot:453807-Heterocapsa_arctica.AAC.1